MADEPSRILIVDDSSFVRKQISKMLADEGYRVEAAENGHTAMKMLESGFDLVISDLNMPGMDGHELVERMRAGAATRDVPVIMITSADSPEERIKAVETGANDFVSKSVSAIELKVRTRAQLKLKQALDTIKGHEAELEERVRMRTTELQTALEDVSRSEKRLRSAHMDTIRRLAIAAEYKDGATSAHITRMGHYAEVVAGALGLSQKDREIVLHASQVHDIGKLGIPEAILHKPAKLNTEEWEVMKTHADIGGRILADSPSKYIQAGQVVAVSHHEKWDGTGYPLGTAGENIPVFGRICAIADVYDALISKRPYKDAYSVDNSLSIMRESRGKHFDPKVFDAFMDNHALIEELRNQDAEAAARLANG